MKRLLEEIACVKPSVLSITACVGKPVTEGDWVTEGVCVGVFVEEAVALGEPVPDGVSDWDGVTDAVSLAVCVGVLLGEADWLRLWLWLGELVDVEVTVWDEDCDCDFVDDEDGVAVPLPVCVTVLSWDTVTAWLALWVCVGDTDWDGLPDEVCVCVADCEGLIDSVWEPVAVAEGDWVTLDVCVLDGVALWVWVRLAEVDWVTVPDGVGVDDRVCDFVGAQASWSAVNCEALKGSSGSQDRPPSTDSRLAYAAAVPLSGTRFGVSRAALWRYRAADDDTRSAKLMYEELLSSSVLRGIER
jgi:hypothetical protein